MMKFKKAIKKLADGNYTYQKRDNLIEIIFNKVKPLCKTQIGGDTDETTSLYDWLWEGDYTGKETPKSLAKEWDESNSDE
jgi:hypothetical protein